MKNYTKHEILKIILSVAKKYDEKLNDKHFKISYKNVTVKEVKSENGLKGFATVVFQDCFKITNITIREKAGSGALFVSMPSYRTKEVDDNKPIYSDICYPVTKEFRESLYSTILETYQQEKEKQLESVTSKSEARREEAQKEEKKEEPEQKPAKSRKTAKK